MTDIELEFVSEVTDRGKVNYAVLTDGRRFVVEDPEVFAERARLNRERIERGILNITPLNLDSRAPSSYSLANYQTPIKNQMDRGTCWAFAGAAALEAEYRRTYGISLDLSEEYIVHIDKCMRLPHPDAYVKLDKALHENLSSIWDNQGGSDIIEQMMYFGVPEEKFAPYHSLAELDQIRKSIPDAGSLKWGSTQEQLDAFEYSDKYIPFLSRLNARYHVKEYAPLLNNNTETLEQVISSGHEVVVDLNWGHVVLLIGYDHNKKLFLVKNSWGDNGFLEWSYDRIEKEVQSGYYITKVSDPKLEPDTNAMWIGQWNMDNDGHKGKLIIRRFSDFWQSDPKAATKVGNYYQDGNRYDVNGYFTENGRGLIYYIAGTQDRIRPGTLTGSRFETYIYSWDRYNAAGTTEWHQRPFGVAMSRNAIPGAYSNKFSIDEWKGKWDMNHDGWRGKLIVNNIQPFNAMGSAAVNGSYIGDDGRSTPWSGAIQTSFPNLLRFVMGDSKYELLYHTWEDNVFSGITYWHDRKFGLHGIRAG